VGGREAVTIALSTATFALEHLFNRIVAETLLYVPPADPLDPPPIACAFGWRAPATQINQGPAGAARVILSPGDPTGKIGSTDGADSPGRNPRPIATLHEIATLYLWARDATDASDLAQWRAARRLHDVVFPIIHRNFKGRWKELSKAWLRPELERRFGAELQIVIAVEAMIPDSVIPQATGGTIAPAFTINGEVC
jgi:hypothetical protein